MLTIYTPQITNRLRYTFDLIFHDLLAVDFQLVQNVDAFSSSAEPKMSYGNEPVGDELFFGGSFLLFEKGVKRQDIKVENFEGTKVFFQLQTERGEIPFDLFAATFYLVSRFEEYFPHEKDQYGRYKPEQSLAYKNNFLHLPVVNHYAHIIKEKLQLRFPQMKFAQKKFQCIPTYDIDSAYAFLNKGAVRNIGGLMKALLNFDLQHLQRRVLVLAKIRKDPFDTYDWMDQLHSRYNLQPIYFFLVGDYDEYDKNISINISEFRQLIKYISDSAEVGIHPSYASSTDSAKLKKELERLSAVLKRSITKSRQHFLRLQLPETYQQLLDFDITDDYTMGYAQFPGFRAGICSSFYFYDLLRENKTTLRIHPFAVMDATLNYYQKLTPQQIPDLVYPVIDEIKKVNGTFISLWHNNSLSDEDEWKGWRKMYENLIGYALQ